MLSRAQKCIFIQKLGAGVNNIDIEQANRAKFPVQTRPPQTPFPLPNTRWP
jgi:phosphoglycerate dehydrogenase-like enzyme